MTRLEKCKLAVEKGIKYDPDTGKIYGVRGAETTRKETNGYILIQLDLNKKTYNLLGHHYAYFMTYGNVDFEMLDHINRNKNDNRISNLRIVTKSQNQQNRDDKGYCWVKSRNKWYARIMVNGKRKHLGYYEKEKDAQQAYINAKQIYHIK